MKVPHLRSFLSQGIRGPLLSFDSPLPSGLLHVSFLFLSLVSVGVLTYFCGCSYHQCGNDPDPRANFPRGISAKMPPGDSNPPCLHLTSPMDAKLLVLLVYHCSEGLHRPPRLHIFFPLNQFVT